MTMVEKMARAYWKEWHQRWKRITDEDLPEWDDLPENARAATERCFIAALEAMREPTDDMRRAFWDNEDPTDTGFRNAFNAAIDTAISEHAATAIGNRRA